MTDLQKFVEKHGKDFMHMVGRSYRNILRDLSEGETIIGGWAGFSSPLKEGEISSNVWNDSQKEILWVYAIPLNIIPRNLLGK